jgi:hypothetical protein
MPVRTRSSKSAENIQKKAQAEDIMLFHLFDINETTVKELFPGLVTNNSNNFIDVLSIDISRVYFTKYCLHK